MKTFLTLLLCNAIMISSVFASIEHSDSGGLANCMTALEQDVSMPDTESSGTTNFDRLVTTLRTCIEAKPTSDKLRVQLGWLYGQQLLQAIRAIPRSALAERKTAAVRWMQLGIAEFNEAVHLNPRNDIAWFLLAAMQSDMGEAKDALASYRNAAQVGGKAVEYWFLAMQLNKFERYDDAIAAAEKALEGNPKQAGAWIEMGIARAKLGRLDEARQAADKAVRLQPKDGLVLQQAARIYRLIKRLPESDALLQQALAANPDLAETYCVMARNACDQGNLTQALENAQATLRLEPGHAEAFNTIGRVHEQRGELEQALQAFQTAHKMLPMATDYQLNVAIVFERLNRLVEAEDAYRETCRIAPNEPLGVEALSGFLQRCNRDEEAIAILNTALRAGCTNNAMLQNMGTSLMRTRRNSEALPYLEQVAHENPTNYMTLRNLAQCYKIVHSNFQAVATFQQTIGLCATNWEDHALLGLCLCNLGNLKTSEDEYREAIKWMPTNSVWRDGTTLDMLGVVMKQQGRSAEAIAEIMKFQDANPTNQRSCSLLAECHRLAGDIRSAQKVLRRGLEVLPDAADLWAQLANVEIEIDPPNAMKCAQHALALCPSNFLAHCTLGYLNKTFQHDMAASKTNYEAAIRDNPERKEPYNALGEMFGKAGDVDTAERYFLKSLEIDTTDSTALTSEGYARYLKHDYVGAIDYHARAIAADPKCGLAHYNMALACLETGEYERGIEHWHKAKEVGCKVNERLLQKLEQGRKAIESQPTRL